MRSTASSQLLCTSRCTVGGHAVAVLAHAVCDSSSRVQRAPCRVVDRGVAVRFRCGHGTCIHGQPVRLVTPLSFCSRRLGHRRRRETPAHQHNPSLCCVACPLDKPPATQAVGSAIRNCPAWRRHRTPSRRTRCMPLAEPTCMHARD
jgi:hypothetical protein